MMQFYIFHPWRVCIINKNRIQRDFGFVIELIPFISDIPMALVVDLFILSLPLNIRLSAFLPFYKIHFYKSIGVINDLGAGPPRFWLNFETRSICFDEHLLNIGFYKILNLFVGLEGKNWKEQRTGKGQKQLYLHNT